MTIQTFKSELNYKNFKILYEIYQQQKTYTITFCVGKINILNAAGEVIKKLELEEYFLEYNFAVTRIIAKAKEWINEYISIIGDE